MKLFFIIIVISSKTKVLYKWHFKNHKLNYPIITNIINSIQKPVSNFNFSHKHRKHKVFKWACLILEKYLRTSTNILESAKINHRILSANQIKNNNLPFKCPFQTILIKVNKNLTISNLIFLNKYRILWAQK